MDVLVELQENSFAEQYEKRGLLTAPHTATDLIANGVTVSEGALPGADAATERSAAVDKIEGQREPEDFIGHRKPGQEWISVKDRLPEPFKGVIVCRPGLDEPIVEQGRLDVNGWWKVYGTRTKAVTHWMPLPKAPCECEE